MTFRELFVPEGAPLLYRSWADYEVRNFSYSLAADIDKCGMYTQFNRFQGLVSMVESAAFKFGICCEEAIVEHMKTGSDAAGAFTVRWEKFKTIPLDYSSKDGSWEELAERGPALMRLFVKELQKPPLLDLMIKPEFGVVLPRDQYQVWHNGTRIDYVADLIVHPPQGDVLLDFKTTGVSYKAQDGQEGYVALDPQLQTGALCSGIRRVGFIALVKFSKNPRVEVELGTVTEEMLVERDLWLKEQYHKLLERKLHRRTGVRWPSDHCKICQYLPKCLGNEKLASETLKVKQYKGTTQVVEALDSLD